MSVSGFSRTSGNIFMSTNANGVPDEHYYSWNGTLNSANGKVDVALNADVDGVKKSVKLARANPTTLQTNPKLKKFITSVFAPKKATRRRPPRRRGVSMRRRARR
jgi:hypothetical protein